MDTDKLRKASKAVYLATDNLAADKSVADDLSKMLAEAASYIDQIRSQSKLTIVEKTHDELEEIEKKFPCCNSDKICDVFVPVHELNTEQYNNMKEIIGADKAKELNNYSIVLFYAD